jgi:hypothetical protein
MTRLTLLASGQAPAYICTRLFHPAGRLVGIYLERGVREGLSDVLQETGLMVGGPLTFLPYRDSNGVIQPVPGQSFTRDIYTLDAAQVRRASLMALPVDDLQIDSGIAFELGLAWGLGLPTLAVILNSISLLHGASGSVLRWSPLLEGLTSRIVDAGAFPLVGLSTDPEAYQHQVEATLLAMSSQVRTAAAEEIRRPSAPVTVARRPGTVHLEFGLPCEGSTALQDRLSTLLLQEGWNVTRARRWEAVGTPALPDEVQADLAAACGAEVLVTLGDGPDVDAEVAAVQGARTATGRPTVLLRTTPVGVWDGPAYLSVCNLMIAHSATHVASSVTEAVRLVGRAAPELNS